MKVFERRITRREMLAMGLLGSAALLLPLERPARSQIIGNTSPAFTAYENVMPLPKVARPVRRTKTTDYYRITMKESRVEVIPGIQTEIWGYDGLYPGPTIKARSGRRVVVRQSNELGEATSIHTHGAYTDGDSDGHPADLIMPGKFKDYFFGNKQNARTMWYHDHAMDITEAHVSMGLAGFYLIEDRFENRLPLPKGKYDVSMVIQDREFASDGSFVFGLSSGSPFKNVPVVNGKVQPRFEVERRKYRFRILDGSVSRNYDLQLESGEPFTLIASEGGLREKPLEMTSLRITPGERYEIVVDFSKYQVGDQLILKNLDLDPPLVPEIMRFDVVRSKKEDRSSVPSTLRPEQKQYDQTHLPTTEEEAVTTRKFDFGRIKDESGTFGNFTINGLQWDEHRVDAFPQAGDTEIWEFTNAMEQRGFVHPVHVHLLNYKILGRKKKDASTFDPPLPQETSWKETVAVREDETLKVLMKWPKVPKDTPKPGEYNKKYAFHCHNIRHEDIRMMTQFEVV